MTSSIGEDIEIVESNESSTVVAQPAGNSIEDIIDVEEIEEEAEKNDEPEQSMHVSSEDDEDVENVEVVGAQTLGFGAQDVLAKHPQTQFAPIVHSFFRSVTEYMKGIRFPRLGEKY